MDRKKSETVINLYDQWHEYARNGNVEALLALYHNEAVLETPLIPVLLKRDSGILKGHEQLRHFFEEGVKRRPNELVRWQRNGKFFSDGDTLIWEYPHLFPGGIQVDILEVMELKAGKIIHHKIYWGWFGTQMLIRSAMKKQHENT